MLTSSTRTWLGGMAVALAGGVAASVLPVFECVAPGMLGLCVFAVVRRRSLSAWLALPGRRVVASSGLAIALAVVALAHLAPFKYLDRSVGPLPQRMTAQELAAALTARGIRTVIGAAEVGQAEPRLALVQLPAEPVSLRSLLAAVEEQTGLVVSPVGYCGNGCTVLQGCAPIGALRLALPHDGLQDDTAHAARP